MKSPLLPDDRLLIDMSRLDRLLHAAMLLLTAASAVRFVTGHGLTSGAMLVLGAAAGLLAWYAVPLVVRLDRAPWLPATWLAVLLAGWAGLVVAAPSFGWSAVPLAFTVLQSLRFRTACLVIAGMVAMVVVTWSWMLGSFDPTLVLGPAAIALLSVVAYRQLQVDAIARHRLVNVLQDAQGDLAAAQHRAGALAERARLSREIHDSVAQRLSSINLLLRAAEQAWQEHPDQSRQHVGRAADTAREGLDEVRRVVRDLAPAALAAAGAQPSPAGALDEALRREAAAADVSGKLDIRVRVVGEPAPVGAEVATAVLRTVRGALANAVEHSTADTVVVTLTYQPDAVTLDVRDDGRGFDPARRPVPGDHRGHGLAGIRNRVESLGGTLVLESTLGEGTALAAHFPLGGPP